MSIKLIFLSGSIRKGSLNTALAKTAFEIASRHEGVDAEFIDLANYELPIFNEDIESDGFPENATKLKEKFKSANGFFIASPEYNSSFSPLLKNSLDWISRAGKDEAGLLAFNGKVAAISAASPGGFGGLRGLVPLRMMLGNINVHVIPQQLAVSSAFKKFDDSGKLNDDQTSKQLENVISAFVETSKKLSS